MSGFWCSTLCGEMHMCFCMQLKFPYFYCYSLLCDHLWPVFRRYCLGDHLSNCQYLAVLSKVCFPVLVICFHFLWLSLIIKSVSYCLICLQSPDYRVFKDSFYFSVALSNNVLYKIVFVYIVLFCTIFFYK